MLSKYRRTTIGTDKVDDNTALLRNDKEDVDIEKSTNGPYDSNFHANVELQDDPVASVAENQKPDDEYVSTIEPDTVTVLARSFNPSSKK